MRVFELAIKAGRTRQSPLTRFIHTSYEDPERGWEVVPLYENFCFALALCKTKTVENILEAKALMERLFAFQVEDQFPIYIHDYPVCKSYSVNHRIALVAAFLLRDFDTILGDHLRHRLEKLLLFKKTPDRCQTPQDWAYFLIHSQLDNTLDRKQAFSKWDKEAACFQGTQRQYHYEPEVTLLDLIMGEWTGNYSPRSLKDHPCHLEAALIDPLKVELPLAQKNWAQRVWLYQGVTHSTFLQALCETEVLNDEITFLLSESCIEDQVEISYYVNKAADTQLWIENAKATSFELGQKLTLLTGGQRFEMTFSLEEGAGHFWGHIYYGNRPHQTGNKGIFKFDVFDLKIALRTVQRKQKCMIKLKFKCLGENRTMLESKLNNEIAQI